MKEIGILENTKIFIYIYIYVIAAIASADTLALHTLKEVDICTVQTPHLIWFY